MPGPLRSRHVVVLVLVVVAAWALPVLHGIGAAPRTQLWSAEVTGWRSSPEGWLGPPVAAGDAVLVAARGAPPATLELRARTGDRWSPWYPVTAFGEDGPDTVDAEAADVDRTLSDPVWVGRSDALQVRVAATARPGAVHLEGVSVGGGDGLAWRPPAPGEPGAAEALGVWPPMVPRSAWDPDGECRPRTTPEYAPTVERAYVHHTAIFPEYGPEESDDLIRAICRFHRDRRGFDDIGYNFVIDRYGTIFQGRAGGILRPVVGAHASGFNHGSVGIALLGNFETHEVPPAALASLDRLLAWLFEWYGIDPYALTPHVSTGGDTTPHPAGTVLMLPAIVGHRQTATNTSCPGEHLFAHVNGPDPAAPRVAALLAGRGVAVGPPPASPPPVVPEVLGPGEPVEQERSAPPGPGGVLDVVAAAVRALTTEVGGGPPAIVPGRAPTGAPTGRGR